MNCGETPASSGNRRNRPAQNEWMVWIFSPPGVSIARANSRRACASLSASTAPSAPSSPSSARKAASGSIAQHPSRLNNRFCISLAAALV